MDKFQEENRKRRDAVTVGQIRQTHLATLESQIKELGDLIRKGFYNRHHAEAFLKDNIGQTLTTLDNVDSLASIVTIAEDFGAKK
jgi:hypothetical protein